MAPRSACALAFASLLLAFRAAPAAAPDISDTERQWLDGATPPLAWAVKAGMPIDIALVPAAEVQPGDSPLAMGWRDGRCKLFVATRGNPVAESLLAQIPAAIRQEAIEAMAAHEIGHCRHYIAGTFKQLPRGFVDKPDATEDSQPTAELKAEARDMRAQRREEAYADLVGLAWTHAANPEQFAPVQAWLEAFRTDSDARSAHDTGHWLALAHAADAFAGSAKPFVQADALWQRGLLDD